MCKKETWAEIAVQNGITKETFRNRIKAKWTFEEAATVPMKVYKTRKTYALYQGEKILAVGTVIEIAEAQGIQVETVRKFGTPAYANLISENGRRLILLDEDD